MAIDGGIIMDREATIQAIADPELMRRAFTALQEDPGPLEMLHAGAYRIYRNCGNDCIIVSAFGPVDNGTAMIYTMGMFGEYLAAQGILTADIVPSSIVFTTAVTNQDEDSLMRHRLIETHVRTGFLRIERECPNARGWYSIILESDTDNLKDVVRDLEAEHGN
ncbi:hypothetical protein AALA54_09425 [Oscillospiraceae bacterium 44-34]|jgi:hypothetical protein